MSVEKEVVTCVEPSFFVNELTSGFGVLEVAPRLLWTAEAQLPPLVHAQWSAGLQVNDLRHPARKERKKKLKPLVFKTSFLSELKNKLL